MSGSPLKTRASSSKKPSRINRSGLNSLNEKELKSEINRIDLSKKQYEIFYSYEQRKIVTRLATKLIRSTSHLGMILNNEPTANTNNNNSISHTPIMNEKKPTLRRGASNLGFTHKKEDLDIEFPKQRPITSIRSSLKSDESSLKMKKNVRWNSDLSDKENENEPNENGSVFVRNKATMYDIIKKYEELKLKLADPQPSILLPQLISANRRSKTEFINSKTSPHALQELSFTAENKKKFLKCLNSEESGFNSYSNCLGYDNFRVLLKVSSNGKTKIKEADQLESGSVEKFKDPFNELESSAVNNKAKIVQHHKKASPVLITDMTRAQTLNSPDSYNQMLIKKKMEEEDKLCVDTFKAQNIRSLTFKQITTY